MQPPQLPYIANKTPVWRIIVALRKVEQEADSPSASRAVSCCGKPADPAIGWGTAAASFNLIGRQARGSYRTTGKRAFSQPSSPS
jgi:hypothetical protein